MSTLHIGKKRDVTLTTSDSSTIAAGALVATSNNPAVATVSVNALTNLVTVTGVATGPVSVSYSVPGYSPLVEVFNVAALPTLIATDSAEY